MAMADIVQKFKGMTTRQKAITGVILLVVIIVIWQIMGLFGGETAPPPPPSAKSAMLAAGPQGMHAQGAGPIISPQQMRPQPAPLQKQTAMSEREIELLKLQQETQTKYLSALNELQMLKVERELAETTQAIAVAKLATITAQKNIVDLLVPPAPAITAETYAKGLAGRAVAPAAQMVEQVPAAPVQPTEVTYTVISVSQLQYKWNAVLGYKGNLYNVSIGDVLPPDGSKILSIDRTGVLLDKNGAKKKISLVPII